jgi:hypothetical protein
MVSALPVRAAVLFLLALLTVRCSGADGSAGGLAPLDVAFDAGGDAGGDADGGRDAAGPPDAKPTGDLWPPWDVPAEADLPRRPDASGDDAPPPADTAAPVDVEGAADLSAAADVPAAEDLAAARDVPPPVDVPIAADVAGAPDAGFPADPVDPYGDGPYRVVAGEVELELKPATGPFGIGRVAFDLDVWLPEGEGPFPLVVFSPAFQLGRANYRELGRRAASHGLLVLVPSYGDGALSAIDHSDLAAYVSRFIDVALAESQPGGRFPGAVDPSAVVTGGHSRGGKIALLAAIRDERVAATVTFDPVDSTGNPILPPPPTPENPSVTPELMPGYLVPGVMIGAGKGGAGLVPCAPTAENFARYFEAVTVSPFVLVELPTAGHLDFAESAGLLSLGCPGGDDPAANRAFAQATLVSFVKAYVQGDARYRPWADGSVVPPGAVVTTR